jgi:hypothetical protein
MFENILIVPTHSFDLGGGRVLATSIPQGRWRINITVVTDDGLTIAWAEGIGNNGDAQPFTIAAGRPLGEVRVIAQRWKDSATATVSSDRITDPVTDPA